MIKVRKADEGTVALGTTSLVILNENQMRKYACIYNASAAGVWLAFGKDAVSGKGVYLAPGGHFEINQDNLWCGVVEGLAASGTGNVVSTVDWS